MKGSNRSYRSDALKCTRYGNAAHNRRALESSPGSVIYSCDSEVASSSGDLNLSAGRPPSSLPASAFTQPPFEISFSARGSRMLASEARLEIFRKVPYHLSCFAFDPRGFVVSCRQQTDFHRKTLFSAKTAMRFNSRTVKKRRRMRACLRAHSAKSGVTQLDVSVSKIFDL